MSILWKRVETGELMHVTLAHVFAARLRDVEVQGETLWSLLFNSQKTDAKHRFRTVGGGRYIIQNLVGASHTKYL